MSEKSEVTLQLDMPPEHLREMYENARGDGVELAKLIWLEHTGQQSDAVKREEADEVLRLLAIQPPKWDRRPRGLTAGAMAALEMLHLGIFEADANTPVVFGDLLIVAYITQSSPDSWYDALTDRDEICRRAIRWGTEIDLSDITAIAERMLEQVSTLGATAGNDASKSKKKHSGSYPTSRR